MIDGVVDGRVLLHVRGVMAGRLFALLFALLVSRVGGGLAQADWWDDLDRGNAVPLGDIVAHPSRHQDEILTFFCVFRQRDNIFAPLAAPFQPQKHENVAVWADGTPVWEKEGYTKDYPFLYIARSHPQHADVQRLEEFTRLEVTGRIKGAIRARPCIEILSFRETGQRLGRHVVQSVMAGDRYSELGELELAYENYRRALTPDLPPTFDLFIRRRVSDALRRLGRIDEARTIEGGDIIGGTGAPDPKPSPPGGRLGDPLPGQPGGPGTTPPTGVVPPVTNELPGERIAPGPVSTELPGQPAGEAPPAFPPAAPPSPVTNELPGQVAPPPTGPPPITSDLPGTRTPPPPIVQAPPAEEDEEPPPPEEAPPPPAPEKPPLPPGAPPRRAPRLSGVK